MSVSIKVIWPSGRFHAHPWGVNPTRLREAEWPPSPWRLLRAIAATWFRVHAGQPTAPDLATLLETLGRGLPDIGVGPASFASTVHYQPNLKGADLDLAVYARKRHENHFVATDSPVVFRWQELSLNPGEAALLASLLPELGYFGRAESACEASCTDQVPVELGWCEPCLNGERPIRRIAEDCRDVFCANPADFRMADLWEPRASTITPVPTAAALAPEHFVDALAKRDGMPDGALWVSYRMPAGWPGKWVVRHASRAHSLQATSNPAPRVAHYLRFSLQCRIPVPVKFTVPLAERFRAAAIARFTRAHPGMSSFSLSGHDLPADAKGAHQGAFYLPGGRDGDPTGTLTDLHVWSHYGFTQDEVDALLGVKTLQWGSGKYGIRLAATCIAKDIPAESPIVAGKISAKTWRSQTPFIPPRFFYRGNLHKAKLKVSDAPEQQLIECLHRAGVTTPGTICRVALDGEPQRSNPPGSAWEIVRAPEGDEAGWSDAVAVAVRERPSGNDQRARHGRRIGFFFEITFEQPVALPFPALGHSAHFGLGLFVPADP